MNNEPILFSLAHFREIILASFDLAGVKRFVEIGSQYGLSTEQLCDYAQRVGGQLITIDPAPQPEARAFIGAHHGKPYFQFIESTSLEELPKLRKIDAYIIDGDHNYYTVRSELEAIARTHGNRPWLIFAHDVCWPWGRRDLYYAPERIPAEARHPFRYNVGVAPESAEPFPGGFGDVPGLAIAVQEGGPHNGVRTAIEDFLKERPGLRFDVIPVIFGVGVIYSGNAPWTNQLSQMLRPYTDNPLLERMEQNRIWLSLQLLQHNRAVEAGKKVGAPEFPPGRNVLEVFRVQDREEFTQLWDSQLAKTIEAQSVLSPGGTEPFTLNGYCSACGGTRELTSDFMFASPDAEGQLLPAWRERQICVCRLNCRQRSCFHLLTESLDLNANSRIYCTEQQTDLFRQICRVFPCAVGSEYYGNAIPLGSLSPEGIRNEDITRLTFAEGSFDCVFSLDVMEHVPDYRAGLREMARCLKPGGTVLLTAPFCFDQDTTVVRARVQPDGTVIHDLPPVYHGDPINPKGVLCFNDFGWDFLDDLRAAGFGDATVIVFTAPHFGYIGLQYVFLATRSPATEATRGNFVWRARASSWHKRPRAVAAPVAESTESLQIRVRRLHQEARWEEATPVYTELTKRHPNDLNAWRGRVRCYRARGHAVLAGLVRDEALERHPEWAASLAEDELLSQETHAS